MNPNIELIDRYLSEDMDLAEREVFESALAKDPELQKQLEQIRLLKDGIHHKALKELISKGFKSFKLWKTIKPWMIGSIILVVAVGGYWLSKKIHHSSIYHTTTSDSLTFVQHHPEQLLSPELELQYASLDNNLDTIIESRNGMLILIPAEALIDEKGNVVEGKVTYVFQEALKPEQIIIAGLSTTSDSKLLETGGMFQIAAHKSGEILKINPDKKIMIRVPTDDHKADMQLFTGKRGENERINWTNPQPLSKDLIPIEIDSLDFYPPNYMKAMKDLGLYRNDKIYLDSLYFSFSGDRHQNSSEGKSCYDYKRVEPVTIQTIWNKKFNNTLLATKEFEERLRYLHNTCQNEVLELYINNLDKKMYEVDEMATALFKTEAHKRKFRNFAAQRLGKVESNSDRSALLAHFYAKKKKANQEILEKTFERFQRKEKELKEELIKLESQGAEIKNERIANMISEEIKFNTAAVYKQLGLKPSEKLSITNYYTVEISDFNIYNIDRFVDDVSTNRTSGTYTQNGDTAKIVYREWTAEITVSDEYDKVLAYFIPKEVEAYLLADKAGDVFKATLNEAMNYSFLSISIKDNSYYVTQGILDKSGKAEVNITSCKQIQKGELFKFLSKKDTKYQTSEILKDFENQVRTLALEKKSEKTRLKQEDIDHLKSIIFPCLQAVVSISENQPCWIARGKELFENNCRSCHSIHKDMVGPALSGILYRRSEDWIIPFVKNPAKVIASGDPYAKKLVAEYQSAGIMIGFEALKDEDIRSILYYIMMEDYEGGEVNSK